MNKRKLGAEKERMAADYLGENGYTVLQMNYRCKIGEIDIIASNNDAIIFVEVKFRSSSRYGVSIEAVSAFKQKKIRQVAMYYMAAVLHQNNVNCRFDVIGIDGTEITHITDAF
ncbi:MAG: YraN family protein [Eubacteriales bacterium]|nr:YraN family protein [Eubacteriales bacterium]